jgi:hypothetical protein
VGPVGSFYDPFTCELKVPQLQNIISKRQVILSHVYCLLIFSRLCLVGGSTSASHRFDHRHVRLPFIRSSKPFRKPFLDITPRRLLLRHSFLLLSLTELRIAIPFTRLTTPCSRSNRKYHQYQSMCTEQSFRLVNA